MVKFFQKIQKSNNAIRIGKNYIFLTVLQFVNFLLPLVTLPYLVRILGTNIFGLVMFAQSFALFFNVLVDFGFNISATREVSIHRENKDRLSQLFSSVMSIKAILLVVSIIFISILVALVPRFQMDWKIYYLSFGLVIGQSLFPVWFFQGIERMKIITILNILAKGIFTILIFLVVKEPSDYLYVPIFNSIGFIIAGTIGFFLTLKNIHVQIPNKSNTIKIFKESSQLFISNLSVTLYTTANTIILGLFTNNSMVGVYASIEKLILAFKNLYTPFFQAIFPWISSKNKSQVLSITKKLIMPLFTIGMFAFVIILFKAESILNFIYNDDLITYYSNVFRILGAITLFSALNMLFNMLMLSTLKMYKERMKIMLISGITNVVIGIVFVYYFSIYGIAISVAFTEFLLLFFGLFYYTKLKNENPSHITNGNTTL